MSAWVTFDLDAVLEFCLEYLNMINSVSTPQGEVALIEPPVELLRAVRQYMPFGAVRYLPPQQGADFGLVMQCGEREAYAVKQQPVDCDEQQGYVTFQANSILIAHSLLNYLSNGFSGLLMPCAYIRQKEAGMVESGIAYFAAPSPQGIECLDRPFEPSFDGQFGHGFTTMMISFIKCLQESSKETNISLCTCIGLDVRPRSHLNTLGFGFMVIGNNIICLKTKVSEKDPVWTILRATGVTEVYHVPSIPAGISEADLAVAKASNSSAS